MTKFSREDWLQFVVSTDARSGKEWSLCVCDWAHAYKVHPFRLIRGLPDPDPFTPNICKAGYRTEGPRESVAPEQYYRCYAIYTVWNLLVVRDWYINLAKVGCSAIAQKIKKTRMYAAFAR